MTSASSSKRLVSVVGRIAEERAVRGRPATMHRPRIAAPRLRARRDDDGGLRGGGQAEFASFDCVPPLPAKNAVDYVRVYDLDGHLLESVPVTRPATVDVTAGVDYPGMVTAYDSPYADEQPMPSPTLPGRLSQADRDLIDVLFPNSPGS